MTLGDYAFVSISLAVAVAFVLFLVLDMAPGVALAGSLLVGIGLPNVWVGWRAKKRGRKFNLLFPEAVDLIVRALRAGLPVQEAIGNVARDIKEPVGSIFRRVQQEVQLGTQIEAALWRVAKTVQTDEFNFLIVAMSIQRDTGGNLAETLANLSALLRARQQLRLKIRAFTSEARTTMIIMAGLPFLVGGGLFLMSPNYIGTLFTTETGQMVAAAAGLQHGLRHLRHEQDRDHQGVRRPWTSPAPRRASWSWWRPPTFVAFWATWLAITWEPPIEARLRALRTRRMKTRSERGGAAKPSPKATSLGFMRQHRRPAEPAARRGGRPDDAQAAPRRLPCRAMPPSSTSSSSSPCRWRWAS